MPDDPEQDSEAHLSSAVQMSERAREAKNMVVSRFGAMIDKDPDKAVATLRSMWAGSIGRRGDE